MRNQRNHAHRQTPAVTKKLNRLSMEMQMPRVLSQQKRRQRWGRYDECDVVCYYTYVMVSVNGYGMESTREREGEARGKQREREKYARQ